MGEALWCVHVLGPDTLIAQPDQATAETRAKAWQESWDAYLAKKNDSSPFDPTITYAAEQWPYTAEAHARDSQGALLT
jgi:hypothetical protein